LRAETGEHVVVFTKHFAEAAVLSKNFLPQIVRTKQKFILALGVISRREHRGDAGDAFPHQT